MNIFFNQMIPPTFRAVPGPWIFHMSTSNLLPHRCSSKACRMACSRGKSSYVNLTSALIGTFYWCGEEKQAGSRVTIPGILGWPKRLFGFFCNILWEKSQWPFWSALYHDAVPHGVLESSTAVSTVWRQIDLSFSVNLLEEPVQEHLY